MPLGASVSVNGVCLTITAKAEGLHLSTELCFDLSPETLSKSNLGFLKIEDAVHLERALSMQDSLGGHLVSGHVDGVGEIDSIRKEGDWCIFTFALQGACRQAVAPYLVSKGSIAVDGVSLTVNQVRDFDDRTDFDVCLIPHTLKATRFLELKIGDKINLEADLMAKYASRFSSYFAKESASGGLNLV